jgi:phage terminase Nu1 subunit (DNA packaging protein)
MTPGTVNLEAIAKLFDCSGETIRNLAKAGIIAKAARGKYLLAPSITGYIVHLRAQAAGRRGADEKIDAITEGALLKREQRLNYELKNAVLRGEMVPFDDIQPAWERGFRAVRAAVLSIPARRDLRCRI